MESCEPFLSSSSYDTRDLCMNVVRTHEVEVSVELLNSRVVLGEPYQDKNAEGCVRANSGW